MIYLDNAATTFPKPEAVINSMAFAQKHIGANPGRGGHRKSLRAGEIVYSAREALGEMFGCDSEGVIFTSNCTSAINTAVKGVLKKGDHCIISSLEHNSVLRPVHRLKEEGLITYDVAYVNPLNADETVNEFAKLIKGNTKLIVCTYASNVFGTVLPIERIGMLCKRKRIIFIVDAAQAAGSIKIDMKKLGIDILCMPGHKGLYGPMGTGVMLLSGCVIPDSLTEGGTGSFSLERSQPNALPDKFESGTLNFPGIAGLLSGVKFLRNFGGEKAVHSYENSLLNVLNEDLSSVKNLTVYNLMRNRNASPILSFNVNGYHSEEVATALDRNGFAVRSGYHCSYLAHKTYGTENSGVVRVSPSIFNTKNDIKKLVFYINKIANRKKI